MLVAPKVPTITLETLNGHERTAFIAPCFTHQTSGFHWQKLGVNNQKLGLKTGKMWDFSIRNWDFIIKKWQLSLKHWDSWEDYKRKGPPLIGNLVCNQAKDWIHGGFS